MNKITRLKVIDIKLDAEETVSEQIFSILHFKDKTLTLSDNSTYKMSHLIYKPNNNIDIFWDYQKRKLSNLKIFVFKELAYNYLYWLSVEKSIKYKNLLLEAEHKFNIWNNKQKLYLKYKNLETNQKFIQYEEKQYKSRTIYDSKSNSNS